MATKRKGKRVNKAAKSRKKMPRKMLGNKRKSLKNKTSRRKRMNRRAGMEGIRKCFQNCLPDAHESTRQTTATRVVDEASRARYNERLRAMRIAEAAAKAKIEARGAELAKLTRFVDKATEASKEKSRLMQAEIDRINAEAEKFLSVGASNYSVPSSKTLERIREEARRRKQR